MAEALKIRIEVDGSQLSVFDQAGKKLAEVGIQAEKAGAATRESARATEAAAAGWSKAQVAAVGLAAGLAAAATAMAAMKAAWDAATAGINRGGFFDDLSKKLNVSVEELTSMTLALKTSGVSFETYGRSVNILQKNLFDFSRGAGEAKEAFAALGLSAADFADKSPAESFQLVTERLQGMSDKGTQTAVAMKILGRGAAELGPLLRTPAEEMERLRKITEQLGLTLSSDTAAALDAVGDNFTILSEVTTGISQQLAVGMEPALRAITDDLVALAAELINGGGGFRSLGAEIGAWLQGPAAEAIAWVRDFAARIKEDGLGPAIAEAFAEAQSAAGTGAAALGQAMGVALVNAVKSEIQSGFASFQWADYIPRFDPASWITGATSGAIRQIGQEFRDAFAGAEAGAATFEQTFARVSTAPDSMAEALARLDVASQRTATSDEALRASLEATAAASQAGAFGFTDIAGKALVYQEAIGSSADETLVFGNAVDEVAVKNQEYEAAQEAAAKATKEAGDAATGAKSAVESLRESLDKQIASANQSNAELLRTAEVYEQAAREGLTLEQAEQRVAQAMIQVQAAALAASGATNEQVEAFIRARQEALQLGDRITAAKDRLKEMGEEGAEAAKKVEQSFLGLGTLGDSLKDSFSQVFDAIVAGTLDLGDAFKNMGIALGKNLFEQVLDEKFNFDTIFKGNILDLAGGVVDVLGGAFSSVFGAAGSGSGSNGQSLLGGISKLIFGNSSGGSGTSLLEGIGNLFFGGGGGGSGFTFSSGSNPSGWGAGVGRGDWFGQGGSSSSWASGAGGILGGALAGFGGAQISNQWLNTGLGGRFAAAERDILANAEKWNNVMGTALGAVIGYFTGSSALGALGGIISGVFGNAATSSITRNSFTTRRFDGPFEDFSNIMAGPFNQLKTNDPLRLLGMFVPGIDPFALGAFNLFGVPTLGTAYRMGTQDVLGKTEAFGPFYAQNLYRRGQYRPDVADQEALGGEALAAIRGFGAVLGPAGVDLDKDLAKVAAQAMGLANILADMFANTGIDSSEAGAAVKATLGQAFAELGITAPKAFADIASRIELFVDTPWWEDSISGAEFVGESLRGVASIFEATLPAGIDLASLALQGFERDGVRAFQVVDAQGRDALRTLTEDAEGFDKLVEGLIARGFTLDTEDFEERIADLSGSAALIGESLGSALTSGAASGSEAVQRVISDLHSQVVQAVAGVSMQQLFDTTGIAESFESVFAALRRLSSGEFNLTPGTGVEEFRAILEPALADGKANLEAYIPIIQEQIKLWKEVDKVVAEALEPSEFEKAFTKAGQITDAFFGDFQGLVGNALTAGLNAAFAEGGSYTEGLAVFNEVIGAGTEDTLKSAIFNAFLDQAFLAPIFEKWGPAIQYVVTVGLTDGFDSPAVQAAIDEIMNGVRRDAEALGPVIFRARFEFEDEDGRLVSEEGVGDTGGRRRGFSGAATGGFFRDAAIVGEAGMPELVTFTGDGFNVTPLDWETARALMGHGMPGYAQGRPTLPGRGGGGSSPPPRGGGGRGPKGTVPTTPGGGGGGGDDDRTPIVDEDELADFTAAIVDAIRTAFDEGGDFIQDFGDELYKTAHQRLIDAVIEGFSERSGIQRLAENIDQQLERARNIIQSGLGGPDVIAARLANVQARIAANIELMRRQAEQLEPILDQLRLAQLEVDVSGDIGSTIADLISGALDAGDLEETLKRVFYTATIQGIVEALLITGPLADAMDEFSDAMGDAIREAMEDDEISEEEAERIRQIADDWRDRVGPIVDGIGDAFDGLFDDSEDEARRLLGRMRQGANFFGGDLGQAIRRAWHSVTPEDVAAAIPILHQTLDQTIRDAVYQGLQGGFVDFDDLAKQVKAILAKHVLDGLIEAFVQSAIIEGALGPLFALIGAQFKLLIDAILAGAAEDADSIMRTILEAIGRITEIFEDPNFQRIWNELFGPDGAMAEMIRNLGLSMEDIFGGVESSVDRLVDATGAAEDITKDVCKGTCNLKQQTVELGELQLDVGGRGGVATLERYVPRYPHGVPGGGGPGGGGGGAVGYDPLTIAQAQRAFNDWLVDEYGSAGAARLSAEARIKARPDFWEDVAQYAGIPVLDRGADVMGPTLALLAANNVPERVQPLGSAGGMADSADVKALREEVKALREDIKRRDAKIDRLIQAISDRPVEFHGKAIVDGRTAGEIQFAGEKRNRQNRRSSLTPRAGR